MAAKHHKSRTVPLVLAAVAIALEVLIVKRRGYGMGGNVVVRCREGHVYTTIWIPGGSLKSLRFGWARFQYCPVGGHWSLVTLVPEADLSEDERQFAGEHHDVRIP